MEISKEIQHANVIINKEIEHLYNRIRRQKNVLSVINDPNAEYKKIVVGKIYMLYGFEEKGIKVEIDGFYYKSTLQEVEFTTTRERDGFSGGFGFEDVKKVTVNKIYLKEENN